MKELQKIIKNKDSGYVSEFGSIAAFFTEFFEADLCL